MCTEELDRAHAPPHLHTPVLTQGTREPVPRKPAGKVSLLRPGQICTKTASLPSSQLSPVLPVGAFAGLVEFSGMLGPGLSPTCLQPCCFLAGPAVNVALAIEVASIDHISEVNMVGPVSTPALPRWLLALPRTALVEGHNHAWPTSRPGPGHSVPSVGSHRVGHD